MGAQRLLEMLVSSTMRSRLPWMLDDTPIGDLWFGVVHRRHHLFAVGDFVIAIWKNGAAERAAFAGWSSKKETFIGRPIYMSFQRWWYAHDGLRYAGGGTRDERAGDVLLFETPDALADRRLSDPVSRAAMLEALVAAHAASRVGHGSPAPFSSSSRARSRRRHRQHVQHEAKMRGLFAARRR